MSNLLGLRAFKTAYAIAWAVISIGGLIAIPFVRPEAVVIVVIVIVTISIGMRILVSKKLPDKSSKTISK